MSKMDSRRGANKGADFHGLHPGAMLAFLGLVAALSSASIFGQSADFGGRFALGGERTPATHHYEMVTEVVHFSPQGKRTTVETYRLWLEWTPTQVSGKTVDVLTCRRFTFQSGNQPAADIPALQDWSYEFGRFDNGMDAQGQIFGIAHEKFEGLKDSSGRPLPPVARYAVYNAFIDFHSLCNVFAEATKEGGGIQDLREIGQRIRHASAFTEPTVRLGTAVEDGSTFKNGDVNLELKGVGLVDRAACAIVGYDSGESSFNMTVRMAPDMKMQVVGGSHYAGDLYIDLATHWVTKADMRELVVTEVSLPMPPGKIHDVIERALTLRTTAGDTSRSPALR